MTASPGEKKYQGSVNQWLERNFKPECPIRTPQQFAKEILSRMEQIEKLDNEALALRRTVREKLGFTDNTPVIFFGEQSVGLNEPAGPIIGKRLLAHATSAVLRMYMGNRMKPNLFDIRADSDVVNSEAGLYRLTVPDPQKKGGVTFISWLNVDNHYQIPAYNVEVDMNKVMEVVNNLARIYDPRLDEFLKFKGWLWDILVQQHEINYAGFMNKLLDALLSKLGLKSPIRVSDSLLDPLIAQSGGLQFILEKWKNIIELCNIHNTNNVANIPREDTAPFFIYLKGKNKPRLDVKINEDGSFSAIDPRTKEVAIPFFTLDDVLSGELGFAFRRDPRIILYALIFDAHITGGGARYNEYAARVFEDITGIPYFPWAWMDLNDESRNRRGLFQYSSTALRGRSRKLPGFGPALSAVERGEVSALDLLLSLPPNASQLVREQVFGNLENFNMATRIDLQNQL